MRHRPLPTAKSLMRFQNNGRIISAPTGAVNRLGRRPGTDGRIPSAPTGAANGLSCRPGTDGRIPSAPTGGANRPNCGPGTDGRIPSAPAKREKPPAAGGRRPPLRKTETPKGEGEGASARALSYGRRGEAKLRRKFFAKLSFKKAGGGSGWRPPRSSRR